MTDTAVLTAELDLDAIRNSVVERIAMLAMGERSTGYFDEEGDWQEDSDVKGKGEAYFRHEIQARVAKIIDGRVAEILTKEIEDNLKAHVKAQFQTIVEKGVPRYDQYSGRLTGYDAWANVITDTLKLLTNSSNHNNLASIAKKAYETTIGDLLKSEAAHIRETIRKAVDDKLAGMVVTSLREAVGFHK